MPHLSFKFTRFDELNNVVNGKDLHVVGVLMKMTSLSSFIRTKKLVVTKEKLYSSTKGIIYRDLKLENILLQKDGHVVLTDFDLSFKTACKPQVIKHLLPKKRRSRSEPPSIFISEPSGQSNSFVGTEEYVAPEIIMGSGHSSAIDWWALGILLYEMLYGRTPFRGKNRQKTFDNILRKGLTFPSSIPKPPHWMHLSK